MLLSDRVAIVTGGARGIGRAISLKYADEGCSVVVADIDMAEARKTARQVSARKVIGLPLECDVTDSKQVKSGVEKVIAKFGKIDILVNNAGGMSSAPPIEDLEEDLWDKVVDLNLKSNYLFCKAVVPSMKKNKYGKIINLSSLGAINPPKHSIHYNSAKAGVIGFTYDLAYALAPFNINVNVILPGLIQTEFYNRLAGLTSDQARNAFFNVLGNMVPLRRIGTAEDIAGAALYLASDLANYVTGTSLLVSGGLPLAPQPQSKGK